MPVNYTEFENTYEALVSFKEKFNAETQKMDCWSFWQIDIDGADEIDTDSLGRVISYIINRDGQIIGGYPADPNVFFLGFLLWLQRQPVNFTVRLWANVVVPGLGSFAETLHNDFATPAYIQQQIDNQNLFFYHALLSWSKNSPSPVSRVETKYSYYRHTDAAANMSFWRVNLICSEAGLNPKNDDFYQSFFGIDFEDYADLETDDHADRFEEKLAGITVANQEVLRRGRHGVILMASMLTETAKFAQENNIVVESQNDFTNVVKRCVETSRYSKSIGKKILQLNQFLLFQQGSSGGKLWFEAFPGLVREFANNRLKIGLWLKSKRFESGDVTILASHDYSARQSPETINPFVHKNTDGYYTPDNNIFALKANQRKSGSVTFDTGDTRNCEIRLQARRVFFLASHRQNLVVVTEANVNLAKFILFRNSDEAEVRRLFENSGAAIGKKITDLTLPYPLDAWQLHEYGHPATGLTKTVVLYDRHITSGASHRPEMKLVGGTRSIPWQNHWFPLDPPELHVLSSQFDPVADGLVFDARNDLEAGYRVFDIDLSPDRFEWPESSRIRLRRNGDFLLRAGGDVVEQEIHFQLGDARTAPSNTAGFDRYCRWSDATRDEPRWRGVTWIPEIPENQQNLADCSEPQDVISHKDAQHYLGHQIFPSEGTRQWTFPDIWDNLAQTLRNIPNGTIKTSRFGIWLRGSFEKISNKQISQGTEYRILKEYEATGLVEREKRADGKPGRVWRVDPAAYLSPFRISDQPQINYLIPGKKIDKNGIRALVPAKEAKKQANPDFYCAIISGTFGKAHVQKILENATKLKEQCDIGETRIHLRNPDTESFGFAAGAFPPTISVITENREDFKKLFHKTGLIWVNRVSATDIAGYAAGISDIKGEMFGQGLNAVENRPRNVQRYDWDTNRNVPDGNIFPHVAVVERAIFNNWSKYYYAEANNKYFFWHEPAMLKFLAAKPHWKPIYLSQTRELCTPIRFPLFMERALSLCWDTAPRRVDINLMNHKLRQNITQKWGTPNQASGKFLKYGPVSQNMVEILCRLFLDKSVSII